MVVECPCGSGAECFICEPRPAPATRLTKIQRLVARMRAAGAVIPDDYEFHRVHGGRVMRQNGCWSWFMLWPKYPGSPTMAELGSQWPVTLLLAAPVLSCTRDEFGHMDVVPESVTPRSRYLMVWEETERTDVT